MRTKKIDDIRDEFLRANMLCTKKYVDIVMQLREARRLAEKWRDYGVDRRDNHAWGCTEECKVKEPDSEWLPWEEK